jgi:hypothetical protein
VTSEIVSIAHAMLPFIDTNLLLILSKHYNNICEPCRIRQAQKTTETRGILGRKQSKSNHKGLRRATEKKRKKMKGLM